MGEISRGNADMWYQTAVLSTRPYRADQSALAQFMLTLRHDLLDHYPSPTGLTATSNNAQVELSWNLSPQTNATGHYVMRQAGAGAVDTAGFVNAPATAFTDTPPSPFTLYKYWVVSAHSNGRYSLPSDTVQQFVAGTVQDGTMLIVNGVDWATYNVEITNLYANHVLQGNRLFRFWDLFTTGNYPAGYAPIGHGTDSLLTAIWSTHTVLWVFNGYNGDELALAAVSPYLDQYLSSGGNLLLVGKDLHSYLPPELSQRAMIGAWLTPVDWTDADTARAEHPSLPDFGKIAGSTMSLCPEFSRFASPLVFPLYRRSFSTAGCIAEAVQESDTSRFNFVLLSVRPYRAEPTAFQAAMDTLLSDFLGRAPAERANGVTLHRQGSNLQLRWPAVSGAISYQITRRPDLSLPTNRATVVATVSGTNWLDPTSIDVAPPKAYYVVFPVFP
jgi:hypothetical protein